MLVGGIDARVALPLHLFEHGYALARRLVEVFRRQKHFRQGRPRQRRRQSAQKTRQERCGAERQHLPLNANRGGEVMAKYQPVISQQVDSAWEHQLRVSAGHQRFKEVHEAWRGGARLNQIQVAAGEPVE